MSNEHRDGFGSTPELAAKSGADVDDSTADSSGPGDSSPPAAVSTIPFSAFLTSAANALLHEYRHPPEGDRHFTGLSAMKVGVYAITMYAVEGVQRGLQALHVCGQSHGDVKPDNVVMQWDRARFSTRDVLVEFGQTWIGADLSLLSLRAAAAHLHSNAECAPRVSLIDVSDDVVTPKYAPAVSLGGRADDDYAWGLTLIEALVEAEHIGRRFRTSVYHETDAVTALSLPECQQLAPLFRHGGATAEALVTDASLLRLRATPSCSVLRADLELFAACSDAGFDIIDTDSDDAHFLPSVVGSPANDVKRFVAFLEARPLSRSRIQALDEIELPWRAALVVLDRAHRNAGVGTEAATQLQRLRARVLDFTRRGIAAEGGFVPWEAIMRWHSSLPAQTLATVEEKPPRQALGRWPGTANQQRGATKAHTGPVQHTQPLSVLRSTLDVSFHHPPF